MLKKIFSVTGLMILIFAAMTGYYYVKTPAAAIVVSCDELPDSVSKSFSPDAVVDRVVDHLTDIVSAADAEVTNEKALGSMEMLGPRPVAQKVPIRASSTIPVFSQKFKGVDLNFARRLGMYFKAKKSLELRAVGVSKDGWRLVAVLKERDDSYRQTGNAPRDGAQCSDYESCAKDVAEQSLAVIDVARLLNYYINLDTKESNRRILELYNKARAQSAEDLLVWGNAYYALRHYDDALQKYQEALAKDKKSCAAQLARGFLYYGKPHGNHTLADLRQAEQDFRDGVACAPLNKFAQTDICSVLIKEWRNTPSASVQLLTEAQDHCKKALTIDARFVPAAVNIGYSLYRQGKHDEAIRYFENIAQQFPTDSSLFLNYGYCLYLEYLAGNSNRLDEAIEETEQGMKQNPASYAAANNLGFFYYDKGNYLKALGYWEKAEPLRGDDADALAGRALALFKVGRRHEASSFIMKAIDLNVHYKDPNFVQTNYTWSRKAAADLSELIAKLAPEGGQPSQTRQDCQVSG
jgi:tetratricopeptide (TPR) repeat protein